MVEPFLLFPVLVPLSTLARPAPRPVAACGYLNREALWKVLCSSELPIPSFSCCHPFVLGVRLVQAHGHEHLIILPLYFQVVLVSRIGPARPCLGCGDLSARCCAAVALPHRVLSFGTGSRRWMLNLRSLGLLGRRLTSSRMIGFCGQNTLTRVFFSRICKLKDVSEQI